MPYLRCPHCRATHYSVARSSTCPRCLARISLDESRVSVHQLLPSSPDAAAAARQALVETVPGQLPDGAPPLADAVTVATELVTNAVKHGGDHRSIEFTAVVRAEAVRIEVTDTGEGFDPSSTPRSTDGESGWGLYIVDQLATGWGAERGRGFTVWAEVPTGSDGRPSA